MTDTPRHSKAVEAELISDPVELARREAANALEQTAQVQALVGQHVLDGRPFKLRPSTILHLHRAVLSGISAYAGVHRPADIDIGESKHRPPGAHLVAELLEELCDYVNDQLETTTPIHLASYVLWRLNWIHPFTDGNGRTARAVSYLVLSVRVGMILPGSNTIPEQIIAHRKAYYDALEVADSALKEGRIDVSAVEELLTGMLASQLLSVSEIASGSKLTI
jgi:Fic family protein